MEGIQERINDQYALDYILTSIFNTCRNCNFYKILKAESLLSPALFLTIHHASPKDVKYIIPSDSYDTYIKFTNFYIYHEDNDVRQQATKFNNFEPLVHEFLY